MSIFSATDLFAGEDLFAGLGEDLDADLAQLETEIEGDAFGADDFGNGGFGGYGAEPSAMERTTWTGDDAKPTIELSPDAKVAISKAFNPGFLNNLPGFITWFRRFIPDFWENQTWLSTKGLAEAQDIANHFI